MNKAKAKATLKTHRTAVNCSRHPHHPPCHQHHEHWPSSRHHQQGHRMHHPLQNKLACPQATCKTAYTNQESSSGSADPSEHQRDAGKSPGYCGRLLPTDP